MSSSEKKQSRNTLVLPATLVLVGVVLACAAALMPSGRARAGSTAKPAASPTSAMPSSMPSTM